MTLDLAEPGTDSPHLEANRDPRMTEPAPENPKRRPRYRGKNPRHFHEKYKEHQPERYADDVAKVLAGGKTPAGTHRPIMVREILDVLAPRPGEVAVDCTLGYGGHARELLAAVQPGGRLLGIDADPIELPRTEARLRALGFPPDAVVVRRMNYAGLAPLPRGRGAPAARTSLLADLGLSSMQIDDPARGFTFKTDGPLDMRMNPARGRPASDLLSTLGEAGLARLLAENADEPHAIELARAILHGPRARPSTTTRALADGRPPRPSPRCSRRSSGPPRTRSAAYSRRIRIAVNDEFGALERSSAASRTA